ncbi:MAG: hypothetical protein KJ904_09570 [Alphaproteobacteria bacterium]|nr:hypothetical protein [Alphaproteobacteria bacterium]MBU0798033.1 hypothetical protein [Alphaproteobacteria bacterium]MBU0887402.1 hypothetical protein [Alphaproteobacteria bacterium]MBU1811717.1 hypothetical protein [Alphaproteobacteria bacterium]
MTLSTALAGPFGQSAVFPFVAALLAALLMRLAGGPGRGAVLAGIGIPVGWLVGAWLIYGLPPVMPVSAVQKLVHLMLAAAVLGFLLDSKPAGAGTRLLVGLAWLATGFVWIGWGLLGRDPVGSGIMLLALWGAGAVMLWRASATAQDGAATAAKLLAAAFGLAVVCLLNGSAAYGQLAGALAAATAGYFVLVWLAFRSPMAAGGLIGGVGLLGLLGGMAVLFGNGNPVALALLVLCFFVDPLAARLRFGSGGVAGLLAPVVVGLAALLPVAAAIAVAYLTGGGLPY